MKTRAPECRPVQYAPPRPGPANRGGVRHVEMLTERSSSQSDVEPVLHETRDRIITGIVTGAPFLALGIVCWQVWSDLLHWSDIAVFLIMYTVTALGVTVGFHRHLTHRSFKTYRPLRGLLAVLGSAAIE